MEPLHWRCLRSWRWSDVLVVISLFFVIVRGDSDSVINRQCDPCNPLWRDSWINTGERRGPHTQASSRPPLLPLAPRHRLPRREQPLDRVASFQGGEQKKRRQSTISRDSRDVTTLQMLGRLVKPRSSRAGTIIFDFVHPEEDVEKIQKSMQASGNLTDAAEDNTNTETTNSTTKFQRFLPENSTATKIISRVPQKFLRHNDNMLTPRYQPNVEVSLSANPSSMFRLAQNAVQASAAFLGAFGATLRLLAPMIVARRVLTTVGYVCYDYYYGRYIRTTYNKQYRIMQQYEIPSAMRACGRMGLQLISMSIVGTIARVVLHRAPCFLPEMACRYWFGSVWIVSVLLTSLSTNFWMKKYPALQLKTVTYATSEKFMTPASFFTRPWHILQWLKDPETWLLNLTRLQRHPNFFARRRNLPPVRPDPLLFPSTWPPLQMLSSVAVVHAIAQTSPMTPGANTRILMQNFCLAIAVLDEWKRIFLYEQRITLGVVWSVLTFGAFLVLACATAWEVGWVSASMLLPVVFACLVSGWMNTVLYSEHHVQKM